MIIHEMRSRDIKIATFEVGEPIPPYVGVVITTDSEADAIGFDRDHIVIADPAERADMIADRALLKLLDIRDADIIIGIDPGEHTGVAAVAGDAVLSSHRVPATEVYQTVDQIIKSIHARSVNIRIGHGARLIRTQLINSLLKLGVRMELVDETGTTPTSGRDPDIRAAIKIARLKGVSVGQQSITPTNGEIRLIQDQSREQSDGKLTISRVLAEGVATGKLSLKDAISIQKNTEDINKEC
ncbi:MAG TPA: hypothetical protein EYP67_04890 [Methanosarcinales archaeon]|nr:hypothetical protein [Methanosarcinales archaeon]